jgi:hypothetical protein
MALSTDVYDAHYFSHLYQRSAEWLEFFGAIAEKIVSEIRPATVLDAGCALGLLVESLRLRGVQAYGVDVSEFAIRQAHEDVRLYCRVASILEPLPQRYDLIVCLEVMEHLPAHECDRAMANLCRAADDILFSSTPSHYGEVTHWNVQPPEFWAERFALLGFARDVDFDATFVAPWAARFRRNQEPLHRVLRGYERRFWMLWRENQHLRQLDAEIDRRLAKSDKRMQTLQAQVKDQTGLIVTDIADSPAWWLALLLWRLRRAVAPPGTRRDRLVRAAMGALRGRWLRSRNP